MNIFPTFLLPALKRLPKIITIKETSPIFIKISCFIVLLVILFSIFCNKNLGKARQDHTTQRTSKKDAVCIFTKLSSALIERAFGRSRKDLQQLYTTTMKEYLREVNLVVQRGHCSSMSAWEAQSSNFTVLHFNPRTSRTYHRCQT